MVLFLNIVVFLVIFFLELEIIKIYEKLKCLMYIFYKYYIGIKYVII